MFKKYFIDQDFVGARFDRWFKNNVSKVPQSYLEKNLRIGKIKVNNKLTFYAPNSSLSLSKGSFI